MPRTTRYHLDEHIDFAVAQGLRRRGIDVTTPADAGLLGAEDPDHIAFAVANGRVIFSNDPDFLRLHDQGVEKNGPGEETGRLTDQASEWTWKLSK